MADRRELLWRIERAVLSMQALGYSAEQIEKILKDVFQHRPQAQYSNQELLPMVRELEKRVSQAKRWILYFNSGTCNLKPVESYKQ
ncbi:hypothetical protein [Desulforamulus ruminis]|uniref:Uncharacterized protein n=1 Tax=Desulforamulus ruminis (strain ATCC 23193 / DSM 2154 / NCIMB 8452 / DL) TaxID=696281 RepID=F6DT86_DESRL|nr:hypothetical protein [Desulforamulus ruminis]AEG61191.1 hypothetical protein Desru_2978 [Desulforamulus ruminis DSM 2154]